MEEMVASAVVEEAVSGAFSFIFSSREEKVSKEHLMERLQMAHINLDSALTFTRTRRMPITTMPLVRKKKCLLDVFSECDDLLGRVIDHQQVVPSLRRKIMHAVLPFFIVPNQDVLSSSAVARFEWFVKEARKFVKDMESGCSPSRDRFHNPLTRHLHEGKNLYYQMVRGSQDCYLRIYTASVEEYGRVACLSFQYGDLKAPLKSFWLLLILRLYESTDIVGVAVKCLQSLGSPFKSLADVATGELTQVLTQDVSDFQVSVLSKRIFDLSTSWSPDPFCCISNGRKKPCANDIISSELTGRFPQEVMLVTFHYPYSAYDCYMQSSTDEACINTIKAWPHLKMSVSFLPHMPHKLQGGDGWFDQVFLLFITMLLRQGFLTSFSEIRKNSLHYTEELIQTEAIHYFISHPELTEYVMPWRSAHGFALFTVSKPISKTRRVSKRRR
ncbi:uncharacterized protein LOC119361574 [Triticum dicoccoides]|uniref:uncharacterized protein LOC119361574 n=1 Tax=Triticum dicoccoides TaxID=85692 RepID=UPI00188F7CB0|nr:uncharacterized protein LOC119361574 [Triticum dicoccoides]